MDIVILNANIVTMNPLALRANALAVVAGRVAALGTDEQIRALAGPETRVIDAGGRLVLPGFQDTHIHLQDSGQDYSQNVDLGDAATPDELADMLAGFAKTHARPWVNGTGWSAGDFGAHNLDRKLLDRAVPDRPCLIVASDGHNACMNSKGCEAVGLVAGTPDPMNGHFVLDENGEPTGLLYEDAVSWAEDQTPRPTDDDFVAGVKWAQKTANQFGLTGVQDPKVEERHARVYRRMADAGELTLRVAATAKVFPREELAEALERLETMRCENQTDMYRIHAAKFFLDGVIENRTATMIEPYSDDIGGNAPLMFTPEQILTYFPAFDAARFQLHVHVIGDGAARIAFDGVEAARRQNTDWPALHQFAHIQCIDPADIPRFRQLGVVANVQPLWARAEPSVTEIAAPMIGPERTKWMYAFRSMADAGAPMALSSDWGVSTMNPFAIIETALTRQPPAKSGDYPAFLPEQRLTMAQCISGYTVQAAAAAWRSRDTGTLDPGKFADLIILDRDIFTCDVYDIGDTEVLLTLLAGEEVHRSDRF